MKAMVFRMKVIIVFCLLLLIKQDLSQALEKMKQALASLSSSGRKIANKEKAVQDVLMLQQRHEMAMSQVKDRLASLETHLAQWQR